MQPKKLEFINSLRGIAALYVVFYHLSETGSPKPAPPAWLHPLVGLGGSGVMLFFVVSAFTLCLSMSERRDEETPLVNYFIRRFFRIAPLFYLWMAIYYVRDILVYNAYHSLAVVSESAFFVFNLFPGQEQGYVWASWTLGVEMLFYLLFPLAFVLARGVWSAIALFAIGLILRAPWHAVLIHSSLDAGVARQYYESSLIYHLPTFLFGVVVFHIYKIIDRDTAKRYGLGYLLIAVFCAGMGWLCYGSVNLDHTQGVTIETVLYGALLLGLSVTPMKLFVNKVTSFYGTISYSVYLSHATTLFFMSKLFQFAYGITDHKTVSFGACVIAALLVITPLSWLTYRYIEQPGNDLGRILIRSRFLRRQVTAQSSSR